MRLNLAKSFAAVIFVSALALSGQAALAQTATDVPQGCKAQLDLLNKQYADTGLSTPPKPAGGIERGRDERMYSGAEVTTLHNQLSLANRLCHDGKEQEAMLRMDVVRDILNLPEIQQQPSYLTTE